jgi:hypothetical protein
MNDFPQSLKKLHARGFGTEKYEYCYSLSFPLAKAILFATFLPSAEMLSVLRKYANTKG